MGREVLKQTFRWLALAVLYTGFASPNNCHVHHYCVVTCPPSSAVPGPLPTMGCVLGEGFGVGEGPQLEATCLLGGGPCPLLDGFAGPEQHVSCPENFAPYPDPCPVGYLPCLSSSEREQGV